MQLYCSCTAVEESRQGLQQSRICRLKMLQFVDVGTDVVAITMCTVQNAEVGYAPCRKVGSAGSSSCLLKRERNGARMQVHLPCCAAACALLVAFVANLPWAT
jgi:hypothetical protein